MQSVKVKVKVKVKDMGKVKVKVLVTKKETVERKEEGREIDQDVLMGSINKRLQTKQLVFTVMVAVCCGLSYVNNPSFHCDHIKILVSSVPLLRATQSVLLTPFEVFRSRVYSPFVFDHAAALD